MDGDEARKWLPVPVPPPKVRRRRTGQGKGGGAPKHKPTDEDRGLVVGLVMCGATQEEIAAQLRLDLKTVRKHYKDEIYRGKQRLLAKVASNIGRMALTFDPKFQPAAFFIMKTQGKWQEAKPEQAPTGPRVFVIEGGLPD